VITSGRSGGLKVLADQYADFARAFAAENVPVEKAHMPSTRGAQPKKTDRESMSHRAPYAAWPHCSRNIEAFRSSRVDWNWEYRCADVCQLMLPSLSSGVCTGVACGVDGAGCQADLLEGGETPDGGFGCDTRGVSPSEALRDVME